LPNCLFSDDTKRDKKRTTVSQLTRVLTEALYRLKCMMIIKATVIVAVAIMAAVKDHLILALRLT
jgi:hypothetical protein